jgi:quercetin dioxygenase-like cupin family protein
MRMLFTALLGCAAFMGCTGLLAADNPVKVDNAEVRILDVLDIPHQKSPMHQHDVNRVIIYINGGDLTLTTEGGHVDAQHWKAGQVTWSPATGRHTGENVGSTPMRMIEIELKKPAPAVAPVRKPELDPVALDPQHNVLLFENDQVRVFRSWREPGGSEPMHEHVGAGRAAVLLTDIDASVKLADGTTNEMRGSAGDVFWSGPVTHAPTNVGPAKYEMVVVEVK